jgi:hypothetical protein
MTTSHSPAPTLDDVWRAFIETDRLLKESAQDIDHRFQETDRLLKESAQETDRRFKETDRLLKDLSRKLGDLGGRLGDFVEAMVEPALVDLFKARGITVHQTMRTMLSRDDQGQIVAEVDLLVVNTDTAIVVECKSNLSVDDVNDHLERIAGFKTHWPRYADYRVLGAVAGMVVPQQVGRYAYRKGLFVLAPSGDTVTILNDAKFIPQTW